MVPPLPSSRTRSLFVHSARVRCVLGLCGVLGLMGSLMAGVSGVSARVGARRRSHLPWRLRALRNFRDSGLRSGAPRGRIFRSDDPRHRPFGACERIRRARIRTVVKLNARQHRIRWRSHPWWGRSYCGLPELRVSLPYSRTRGGNRVTIYHLGRRRGLRPGQARVVRYVERQVGLLLRALSTLQESDFPVLIHCSAGRDRTGIVVALLQRIAGLSRTAIEADYVESDRTVGHTSVLSLRRVFRQTRPWRRFLRKTLRLRGGQLRRLRRLVLGRSMGAWRAPRRRLTRIDALGPPP